jgi:hypothetical protein
MPQVRKLFLSADGKGKNLLFNQVWRRRSAAEISKAKEKYYFGMMIGQLAKEGGEEEMEQKKKNIRKWFKSEEKSEKVTVVKISDIKKRMQRRKMRGKRP